MKQRAVLFLKWQSLPKIDSMDMLPFRTMHQTRTQSLLPAFTVTPLSSQVAQARSYLFYLFIYLFIHSPRHTNIESYNE